MFWDKWRYKELGGIAPILDAKRTTRRNTITIYFDDRTNFKAWVDDYDKRSIVTPWILFYRWFFGTDKENFVLRAEESEVLIKRSRLNTFRVEVKEVEI